MTNAINDNAETPQRCCFSTQSLARACSRSTGFGVELVTPIVISSVSAASTRPLGFASRARKLAINTRTNWSTNLLCPRVPRVRGSAGVPARREYATTRPQCCRPPPRRPWRGLRAGRVTGRRSGFVCCEYAADRREYPSMCPEYRSHVPNRLPGPHGRPGGSHGGRPCPPMFGLLPFSVLFAGPVHARSLRSSRSPAR